MLHGEELDEAMSYSLYAEENKRQGEPDARRLIATFGTRDAAIAAARERLDDDVRELWRDGASPDEILRQWLQFGEDAFVAPDDGDPPFSGRDYVRRRAEALAAASGVDAAGDQHELDDDDDEIDDESDDEDDDESADDADDDVDQESPAKASRHRATARAVHLFTKTLGMLICVGFAVGGAKLLQGGFEAARGGPAAWREAVGTVLAARVERAEVAMTDWKSSRDRPGIYIVRVAYQVEIDGQPRKNVSDAPKQTPPDRNFRRDALVIAEQYKPGDPIKVYYQPDDLESMHLTSAAGVGIGWISSLLVVGLALLLLGIGGAFYLAFRFDRANGAPPHKATAGA